jgi:2-octaprenyl-6-methoxyphenol hydroxylase
MNRSFDIVIAGGGMVGASLAVTLLPLGLRVAMIETTALESAQQPSFDERTTALSNGSRNVLTGIGLWPGLAPQATPIRRIHVSDRGRFGFARIDAAEQGVEALGYVLPNRALGAALWARLERQPRFRLLCPATVQGVEPGAQHTCVRLQDGTELTARLVVAADGAQSTVRQALGIAASVRDYGQVAIVTTVATSRLHDRIAYERFTPTGPLALLPLGQDRCAVIWTLAPETAQAMLALPDEDFLIALQETFGSRLGRFTRVGRRGSYPLALTQAGARVARRCAIIGNAAQSLHPIAGQGFNLGLRDVATLAEVIADAVAGDADVGGDALLQRYESWRRRDRRSIVAFTDGLVRLFADRRPVVRRARNLGLLLFDLAPPAKGALSRLSLGFAGRLPRLARGAPLV